MEITKPKLGISACLLGQRVRFDGGHKRDDFLTDVFAPWVEWVPVCPEIEAGMGVPRETVRLVGAATDPQMIAEKSGKDWTLAMTRYAAHRVAELKALNLSGYVFKKDSPSCGLERVRIFAAPKPPARNGRGLFAAAVTQNLPLLPVEEEGRLHDAALRENFIERVFAYHRWQQQLANRKTIATLVNFHTQHKFLLLAHSERHYRQLGKIVAGAKQKPIRDAYNQYGRLFMAALAVHATAKKHANVLDHMMGFFSANLSPDERAELVEIIKDFRQQLTPLIVPITLVRHYVKKYHVGYLANQAYLEPSPKELMLRNHV